MALHCVEVDWAGRLDPGSLQTVVDTPDLEVDIPDTDPAAVAVLGHTSVIVYCLVSWQVLALLEVYGPCQEPASEAAPSLVFLHLHTEDYCHLFVAGDLYYNMDAGLAAVALR